MKLINSFFQYKSAWLGYLIQILSKFFTLALGLLINRWLVSNLVEKELADYSLVADSFNILIFNLISLGIPNLIQKYYTNHELNKQTKPQFASYWTTLFVLRILSYFFGIVLILILKFLSSSLGFYLPELKLIIALYTIQFILIFDLNYKAVVDSLNRAWRYAVTDTVSKVSLAILLYVSLVFWTDVNVWFYISLACISYTIAFGLDFLWQFKFTPFGKIDFGIITKNISSIFYLSLTNLLVFLYLYSMQLFLSWFNKSSEEIVSFSNAYNRVFLTFSTISMILAPNIASRIKKLLDKKDYSSSLKIVAAVAGFSLFYFTFINLAGPIVLALIDKNSQYPLSYPLLRILSFGILVYTPILIIGDLFVFFHKEKYQFYTALFLAILNISLQFILIQKIGIFGSAWALVITLAFDFVIKLSLLINLFKGKLSSN